MFVIERKVEGVKYKMERINTGTLWSIFEVLKAFGKAIAEERNVLLIHLN